MDSRVFGHIEGYPAGTLFESRNALSQAGVHRPTQAGISGSEKEGADSIVLSGGYEDDKDFGDIIVYKGHGGRDPNSGEQVNHQVLRYGNLALARSRLFNLPVRVIRGANHNSPYAPEVGYRYDGLYYVEDYWQDVGRAGYVIWRFRLIVEDLTVSNQLRVADEREKYNVSMRAPSTILRIVRDTVQGRKIKDLYA